MGGVESPGEMRVCCELMHCVATKLLLRSTTCQAARGRAHVWQHRNQPPTHATQCARSRYPTPTHTDTQRSTDPYLHVGAHDGHLHRDDDGQDGHQEGKTKDVVKVTLWGGGGGGGGRFRGGLGRVIKAFVKGMCLAKPLPCSAATLCRYMLPICTSLPRLPTCHSEVMAK